MKILIATPLYPPDDGGPATYSRTLERALPKEGIEVDIVSFSNFREHVKGISHFLYFLALLRASKGAHLIYALDLVSVGLPALIVSKITGKPLVLKMVGDYAWEQGTQRFGVKENLDEFIKLDEQAIKKSYPRLLRLWNIERKVAGYANKIITPSRYLMNVVIEGWNIPSDKVILIYNSFNPDLPKESRTELRTTLGMNSPTIISVGRFVPWKGFNGLMDVIAEVRKNVPGVMLEIAGSGDSSEYVSYANKKGYDFVHFLGLLNHATLMKRIRAADCFALNTGYEGLSHVILEAMALETPVVTTDVGGNPELFAPWSKLALSPYNDIKELHAKILLLLLDKQSALNTAKSASLFVSKFTEERMIKETIVVLEKIMKPT